MFDSKNEINCKMKSIDSDEWNQLITKKKIGKIESIFDYKKKKKEINWLKNWNKLTGKLKSINWKTEINWLKNGNQLIAKMKLIKS